MNKKHKPGRYNVLRKSKVEVDLSHLCPNCRTTHNQLPVSCIEEARRKAVHDPDLGVAMKKYVASYHPIRVGQQSTDRTCEPWS